MTKGLDVDSLLAEVRERGFAVRKFLSRREFLDLSNSASVDFIKYAGGAGQRTMLGEDRTVNVLRTDGVEPAISLHGEQYYQAVRPDLLWFYIDVAAPYGGQSLVADGIEVSALLSSAVRRLLSDGGVRYSRVLKVGDALRLYDVPDELLLSACLAELGIRVQQSDGSVRLWHDSTAERLLGSDRVFINSIVIVAHDLRADRESGGESVMSVSLGDGRPIPIDVLDELAAVSESVANVINMPSGSVLVVDNRRCMHGRRPHVGGERVLLSRMARLHSADGR